MCAISTWPSGWLLEYIPRMENLKHLRLLMTEECIAEESKERGRAKSALQVRRHAKLGNP